MNRLTVCAVSCFVVLAGCTAKSGGKGQEAKTKANAPRLPLDVVWPIRRGTAASEHVGVGCRVYGKTSASQELWTIAQAASLPKDEIPTIGPYVLTVIDSDGNLFTLKGDYWPLMRTQTGLQLLIPFPTPTLSTNLLPLTNRDGKRCDCGSKPPRLIEFVVDGDHVFRWPPI